MIVSFSFYYLIFIKERKSLKNVYFQQLKIMMKTYLEDFQFSGNLIYTTPYSISMRDDEDFIQL